MDNNPIKIPQMCKIPQIAEIYNLPVHFVRSLVNSGEVVAVRVGNKILVNADKFGEYLNNNTLSSSNNALNPWENDEQDNTMPRLKPISKRGYYNDK